MKSWLATMRYGSRDRGHMGSSVITDTPRVKGRRTSIFFSDRCELDDDVEIGARMNVHAPAVNRTTKAYKAGYADGAAIAREERAEFTLSTLHAGKADEDLLNVVGLIEMARMLGVTKPLESAASRKTTLEFRSACDEYNAGYAAGWETEEIAALDPFAQL